MKRSIQVIGHPRCGSGYMAKLISSFGLDVGHEKGTCVDGISSWAFAVAHEPTVGDVPGWGRGAPGREAYLDFDYVIHHVRNPLDALPSICHNEVCFVSPEEGPQRWEYRGSFLYRYAYIYKVLGKQIDLGRSLLEVAIESFLYWNEVVRLNSPHLTVRVEDCEGSVASFLGEVGLVGESESAPFADKTYNSMKNQRAPLTLQSYSEVRMPLLRALDRFCSDYGYPSLFKQLQSL